MQERYDHQKGINRLYVAMSVTYPGFNGVAIIAISLNYVEAITTKSRQLMFGLMVLTILLMILVSMTIAKKIQRTLKSQTTKL